MATDKYPWKLIFVDVNGKATKIRESSTFEYSKSWAQKEALTDPTVVAAGGKGRLESMTDVTPASMVPAPTPSPTPPSPAPGPTPTPPPPSPSPSPTPTPPSSEWVTGKSSASEPAQANPAKGVVTPDPTFNTPVIKISDRNDPPSGFARNDYARRQAFNADNTRQLVYARDGFWHLYDANTFKYVTKLIGPAGDAEPQWHPTDPNKLYYLPTNGVGMKVNLLDVTTGKSTVVGDLAQRIKQLWSTAYAAWTKSEGSPSKDGRYWCFMVDTSSWSSVGVVCWDMQTDTIIGARGTDGERPDHVSMSPSGKWCVVSGDGPSGTVAYSQDFKTSKKLLSKSEHSDIGLASNGDDIYVSVDYQSNAGDVFMLNINTGVRTVLFPSYLSGSARAFHFSCKSFNMPGFVLVSAYGEYGGGQEWMDRKITLVELKTNPIIRNVAWHHSKVPASDGYFWESHASISRDGRLVAFTSGWGGQKDTDLNAYQAKLPAV
jgi:hypothetical protein